MAKTLAQIQKQIDDLQSKAAAIRSREAVGVIARIREAIAQYGITPDELFGSAPRKTRGPGRKSAATKPAKKTKRAASGARQAKYRDENGNTWSGRGRRPVWLTEALANGKTLDQLQVTTGS
jgi:DNA-binding protein H-NS